MKSIAQKAATPDTIDSPEKYAALSNLDDVKDAVKAGDLDPAQALTWEEEGQDRATYKSYLALASDVTVPEEEQPKPKRQPFSEVAERLRVENEKTARAMLQKERVTNPAIPSNPGEIYDWPMHELVYMWVPYFNPNRPLHPTEQAQLRHMSNKGWNFYDPEYLARKPNPQNYPWHPNWEVRDGKVFWEDQVLMYRSALYEERDREQNRARKRTKRKEEEESGRIVDDRTGREYVMDHMEGQQTVDKLLREKKDDIERGVDTFDGRGRRQEDAY